MGKGLSFAENNPHWHHKSNITESEFEEINTVLSIKEQL